MTRNDALFAALAEGKPITYPVMASRHKWYVELHVSGRDDGVECLATYTSPNGRRYSVYLTDMTTDVEVYSRNGHLVTAQFPSNRIPSWMLSQIDFLRDVLSNY